MASQTPYGRTLDADFMFTKLLVNDLEKAAEFYAAVFGIVELQRISAVIGSRPVNEICYQPTYESGPLLILAKFEDVSQPTHGEVILGFATKDMDALLKRVEAAGGTVVESADIPGGGRHAFIKDAEGHLVQVSQLGG